MDRADVRPSLRRDAAGSGDMRGQGEDRLCHRQLGCDRHWTDAAKRRNVIRAKKYKLTVAEVDRLMLKTACDSCGEVFEAGTGRIDHCHKKGDIRGVLCDACNICLGRMGECHKKIAALAAYAKRCKSPKSSP
jgi:hypothetical protein